MRIDPGLRVRDEILSIFRVYHKNQLKPAKTLAKVLG